MKNTLLQFKYMARLFGLVLLAVASSSCVHEWEEDEPLPPEPEYNFMLRLDFSRDLPPYTEIFYAFGQSRYARNTDPNPDLRYTIYVFPEDESVREPLYTFTKTINGSAPAYLDVPLLLPDGNYRFMAWVDYVARNTITDLHYDTSVLTNICIDREQYSGCDDTRDAFRGSSDEVVTVPGDGTFEMEMIRPMAKYRFISTDFDLFLERIGINYVPPMEEAEGDDVKSNMIQNIQGFNPDDYYLMIRYAGYLPSSFNLFTNRPSDAILGVAYRGEFEYINAKEVQICFDYVFVNGKDALVDIAIDIYNRAGQCLASSPAMTVPLLRSHLTTVKGEFLTTQSSGSVGVNPEFEGSFDIIIK